MLRAANNLQKKYCMLPHAATYKKVRLGNILYPDLAQSPKESPAIFYIRGEGSKSI